MEAEARNLWIAYRADRTSQCDRILFYFKGVAFSCCFHDSCKLEYTSPREAQKRSVIKKIVRQHKVDLLLIQESKIHKDMTSIVQSVWGLGSLKGSFGGASFYLE